MFGVPMVRHAESIRSTTTEGAQDAVAAQSQHTRMLETKNLSGAVCDEALVHDISIQVPPGEVVALVGPSGAGKSSFLRLLNRLDEPTGGTVLLKGRDCRAIAPRELRRCVGMVMQTAYLFPGTIAANIAFGPRQRGETLTSKQLAGLLDRVGLPGCQDRDVTNLSGGEAQRVSLARTLANAPEALLLDEPTSALDDVSARGIEDLVLSIIRERRMTCVIVTHNTAQARRIADRTMSLESGRLVTIGPTREVRMITELLNDLNSQVILGLAQAVGAIVLCAALVLLCRRFAVQVERETAISVGRGLVQMVFVGMVLAVLLRGGLLVGTLILLAMTFAAAVAASRRARDVDGSLLLSFYAIAAGSGVVIAAMPATGTLSAEIAVLVPVGSMIIANAMNACAQSVERFSADVTGHVGQIEAGLALGADPDATVAPYVQSAVYASLLPRLDMLKSLGLVWIPGVMAGMMVSGASPVYAGIYQFIIVAMILAASGITGLIVTLLMRTRAFSAAAQLTLRPAETVGSA